MSLCFYQESLLAGFNKDIQEETVPVVLFFTLSILYTAKSTGVPPEVVVSFGLSQPLGDLLTQYICLLNTDLDSKSAGMLSTKAVGLKDMEETIW